MEAEFVLTFAAEAILSKVSLLASRELTLAWGFKAELKKLGESLSSIQDLLRGAVDHQDKAVDKWVKKLKDIAHDADEVLDEFNYEVLRRKVELQNHMKRKVLNFLSASNPLLFRLKMAHKIKKINDALEELGKEAARISLVAKTSPGGEQPDRDQTDSFFEKDEKVVGREDVVSKIVESLTNSNNQQDLSVMAIVGMPGLGKTTVAKSVYHKLVIGTHLQKKIWVCVSNIFKVDTILSQMLESLKGHTAGMTNRDALLKSLREELTGKKYVLVLDDVWSDNRSEWESLMSCLSKLNSTPGSSIIITTRSADVASIAETLPRPELRNLSNEECWSILKQRALNLEVNDVIDADRERIGRAIAEKCGGVPLVAKVLGSMMRSKTSSEWLAIQNSEIWKLPDKEKRIMSVLKLSFDNLKSPPLKQCFAYCSLLRKGFEVERDNLIQLWMAQGLLQPSTDRIHHEIEGIGEEYFDILLKNSLFQEVTKGGTITKYTMHDLVHDLAEEVSKSERLTQDLNDTCEVRHVARIPPPTLKNMSEVTVRRLRSLFSNDQVPDIIFSKFRALRVLRLQGAKIQELSNSFGKLKHLRYLDISYTRIKALPKSIGKLYNLQTLRMQGAYYLKEAPSEMQNLINLRQLYFDEKMKFPAGICRGLTNLQTLSYFNVGKEMGLGIEELRGLSYLKGEFNVGKEMGLGIEELGGLNHLKGELIIRNLENIRDEEEAKKAKLEDKKHIRELSFVWTVSHVRELSFALTVSHEDERRRNSNVNDENVLEGLKPHTMLESLRIENFMGDKFPSWMMRNPLPLNNLKKVLRFGCLANLRELTIRKCKKLKHLAEGLDTLPLLEKLTIDDCPTLEFIPIDHDMASLRELEIEDCDGLSSIGLLDPCTSLQELKIGRCGNLTSIPISQGLASLRKLEIEDCDGLSSIGLIDHCTSLRELEIGRCGNLTSIPISHGPASLRKLEIRRCGNLTSIPISQGLASLCKLEIEDCDGLSSIGILDQCTSLQELKIWGCRNLTSNPISQGLASLRKLDIWNCDGLSTVDILNHCPSLQELVLE